jgi:hypothetical protein
MKPLADLVNELREMSEGFTATALVVGFEATTDVVWNRDPDPLGKLKALVEKGGEPVGMIGYLNQGGVVAFYSRPLEEYAEEDWVQPYLERLLARTAATAKAEGLLGEEVKITKIEKGWLN